ncbi:MAG: hypothetical protein JO359_03685 [Candidatus Eremiobacteraeota bacterium]|nr:hypothetical protein [Candidatus Eremiobacteraeota bacterium]
MTLTYDGSSSLTSATISATAPGIARGRITPATLTPFGATQVTTALQNVESYYLTLPHTSISSDLQALAAHMTASGQFAGATVATGGVDATFSNGAHALIFADKPEDLAGPYSSGAKMTSAREAAVWVRNGPLSAPNPHEVAFLVNESGDSAFHPQRQQAFAAAFTTEGFTSGAGYGVDALDVTLDNIAALGTSHNIDFLDMATHGMVDHDGTYWWQSDTQVSNASLQAYFKDLAGNNVAFSIPLAAGYSSKPFVDFAFGAGFLANHLAFNSGAIVDNQSCFGQSASIKHGPLDLKSRGVLRYYGWTEVVEDQDADGTDAFMLDRLLGEQSPSKTGLDQYAPQRTPPQRPFALDQVNAIMQTEGRSGPLSGNSYGLPYTISDITNGRSTKRYSTFYESDFGGELVANPPIEYALPSIEAVGVSEGTPSLLYIAGTFPATTGSVTITNSFGTAMPAPTSWTPTLIQVPIPATGAGAWGVVSVTSGGIASNAVPLTLWTGNLTYQASGTLTSWATDAGSGSFNVGANVYVAVRADVHPTVVTIDATPEPQNLVFSNVAPNSSAAGTAYNWAFTSSAGDCPGCNVTIAIASPAPTMAPFNQLNMSFAYPGPSCNNGSPGPQGDANPNVFCALLQFDTTSGSTCSTNSPSNEYCDTIGGLFSSVGDKVVLTMDPTTYALTIDATPYALSVGNGVTGSGTATVSGPFAAPLSPPDASTPALRRHRRP